MASNEVREQKSLTTEGLFDEWGSFLEVYELRIDQAKGAKERNEAQNELREAKKVFVARLKKEAEKFDHVFETEKGSVYVVMHDGGIVRFKKQQQAPDLFEYRIQPPSQRIFYLDHEVSEKFIQLREHVRNLIDHEFRTTSYKIGVQPIEFGDDPDIDEYFEFEVNPEGFTVRLKKDIPAYSEPAFPNHIGHPISMIFK